MLRSFEGDFRLLTPEEQGLFPDRNTHDPGGEGTLPAKGMDTIQGGHKSLRGQVLGILDIAGMRQVIAVDADHMPGVQLGKRIRIGMRLVGKLCIVRGLVLGDCVHAAVEILSSRAH